MITAIMAVDREGDQAAEITAKNGELFKGEWFSLDLENPKLVENAIKKGELSSFNVNFDEDLPVPLTEIDFYITQEEDHTLSTLESKIEFDLAMLPELSVGKNARNWRQAIVSELVIKKLSELNGHKVHVLDHDDATAYVVIDDLNTLRISGTSDISRCIIEVELVATDDLQRFIGDEPAVDAEAEKGTKTKKGAKPPEPKFEPYDALKMALRLTVDATNEIIRWTQSGDATQPFHRSVALIEEAPDLSVQFLAPEIKQPEPQHEIEVKQASVGMFDNIGGAREAKERLTDIAVALINPELAVLYDVMPSHFLLHGPAGTGKTSIVKAFAKGVGAELKSYDSAKVVEALVGKSAKNVADIFARARKQYDENKKPIVLFFDEFDSIAPYGNTGTSERESVKRTFNTEIDRLADGYPGIIVATASNSRPDQFDASLVRAGRIEPILVPIPTKDEMPDVWQSVWSQSIERFVPTTTFGRFDSSSDPYEDPLLDFEHLASITEGFTGADVSEILKKARLKKFMAAVADGGRPKVSQRDIEDVIRTYRQRQY
jgi:ATP-dependent 26S proteasome regulatory subunit